MPAPNVDSCVIQFTVNNEANADVIDEKFFFKVVRAAFSQRRKTLANSISSSGEFPKSDIITAIQNSELNPSVRPEQLSMQEFIRFSNELFRLK